MRYHIIEKEPCCASQQNWRAKLDLSIRGPFCPRKRTYLPILELLPPLALRECRHRGLARRRLAVCRRSILVVSSIMQSGCGGDTFRQKVL